MVIYDSHHTLPAHFIFCKRTMPIRIKNKKSLQSSTQGKSFLKNLPFKKNNKRQRTVLTRTDIALNVNRFEQSECGLERNRFVDREAHAGNMGLKEMAGTAVNQTFVHLINCCSRRQFVLLNPPLL